MRVSRGVDDGVVDEVKTEYSEDELPLDPISRLFWRERCPKSEAGWMFPSPIAGPFTALAQSSRTILVRLDESSAWLVHLRHRYRSWLDSVGTSMGVQQRLMRHAQIATIMRVYGDAMMESERSANSEGSTDGTSPGSEVSKIKGRRSSRPLGRHRYNAE